MALPTSYLTSTKNVSGILDAIRAAQAPDKFTTRFLESLGFANAADRLFINVLQKLGFLTGDRTPTSRYFQYLDQTQSNAVMAAAIHEAYADLFRINKTANKMSRGDIVNKMKTLTQGQVGASALDKMAATFLEMCKHADFEAKPTTEEALPEAKPENQKDVSTLQTPLPAATPPAHAGKVTLGGLHYNIQLILPATRDPNVYDVLFRSLKEHLL